VFKIQRQAVFKLCIFGDGGVGKTTLTQRYLTKIFQEDIKMTIGADFSVKEMELDGRKIALRIWDFAGEERYKVLLPSYVRGAHGGIFMFDTTRYASIKKMEDWLSFFESEAKNSNSEIPILMVGGKIDLAEKRSVDAETATDMARDHNLIGYIECSSKTGENVEQIFEAIARKMIEVAGV